MPWITETTRFEKIKETMCMISKSLKYATVKDN
jgi:hypothetical protein